ncbi:MAG: DUF6695 family protein [Marinirhabdus sp.]|nr:DUF6695 family protein [Marinirhabdus sp.]
MKATGKILVLAYPDTFVTMSTEWICKVLPWFGLGTKEYIKAGHAALILIENSTGKSRYFDFGRYITPAGHGRVRGENTDAELALPIRAEFTTDGSLKNVSEFLLWLDQHPEKTHGAGRLLASVSDAIDYQRAFDYISAMQERGIIPYGAFNANGSNCARFVTDALLAATTDSRIRKSLQWNKRFTPSTVGNVVKGNAERHTYQVRNGIIERYTGSALKENLTNYFHRKTANENVEKTPLVVDSFEGSNYIQKLSGTGSSAWFELNQTELAPQHFRIRRYNEFGVIDYDGVYVSEVFDKSQPFVFTYDSHCLYCHIIQNNIKIKLRGIGPFAKFSLRQKQRSA